jgi:16S rRNA U516 pseudouridylate synthase RsuA-like enzyme
VLRLVRVAIGPVQLGDLEKGGHRTLRVEEKAVLHTRIVSAGVRKR